MAQDESQDGLTTHEVEDIVAGKLKVVGEAMPDWELWRHAYNSDFWKYANMWSGIATQKAMPIKVQTNRIFDYVQKFVANLLFRSPRAEISIPAVREVGPGRKSSLDLKGVAPKVTALANEWLKRSDVQEASTYALQMALFHGASAYKVSPGRFSSRVVDKMGVSVVPLWDVLWDDRETSYEQQLYRGHMRWERVDWVEKTFSTKVDDGDREALPGPYGERDVERPMEDRNVRRYVRVLEFYDMVSRQQRFYLVCGGAGARSATLKLIGEPKPFPYPLANGRPGIPIVPVIVANEPSRPLAGLSAVKRQYQFNAELNLMLTILANAMRKDAARNTFVPKGALTNDAWKQIEAAEDGSIIELATDAINLKELFHTVQLPQFSQHIDKYRGWLMDEQQATSGISSIQQGQQGKYLSATEAEFLANSGEIAATEVGSRLVQSVSRLTELAIAAFAASGKTFLVQMPDGSEQELTSQELNQPWVVDIEDAASTPMRLAKRQSGFLQVQKILLDLVTVASVPEVEPATAIPGAAPAAPPPPAVTPETRAMARAQIDFIRTQWDLPETMGWESLSQETPTDPEEQPKPEPELEQRVKELFESKLAEQPPPGTADPNLIPFPGPR